jgi:hypothetical protein
VAKVVLIAVTCIILMSLGVAVHAKKVNLAEVRCGDLSQMTAEEYIVIGAWMSGFYNAKRDNTMIDVKQLAANSRHVSEYCRKNPKLTVMKAIERLSKPKN